MEWKSKVEQILKQKELDKLEAARVAEQTTKAEAIELRKRQDNGHRIAQAALEYSRQFYDEFFSSPRLSKRGFLGRYHYWDGAPERALVEVFHNFFISDFWGDVVSPTSWEGGEMGHVDDARRVVFNNIVKGQVFKTGIFPFRTVHHRPTWQHTLIEDYEFEGESGRGTPTNGRFRRLLFTTRNRDEAFSLLLERFL